MKVLAPIVLFAYNRPKHIQKCLESLNRCFLANQSKLFVYIDAPKNIGDVKKVQEVQRIIDSYQWVRKIEVIQREKNYGLAHNIINGVSEIVEKYKKVIVLEDDLYLSQGFLQYMNEALYIYENEGRVMNINGYMYPLGIKLPETFFYNVISSWGWATWARAWQYFNPNTEELWDKLQKNNQMYDFDLNGSTVFRSQLERNLEGTLDTWAIKWYASVYLQQGFCLNPRKSLVQNMGFDNSGTNTHNTNQYDIPELAEKINVNLITLQELRGIRKKMKVFYRYKGISYKHKFDYFIRKWKGNIYRSSPQLFKNLYKKINSK